NRTTTCARMKSISLREVVTIRMMQPGLEEGYSTIIPPRVHLCYNCKEIKICILTLREYLNTILNEDTESHDTRDRFDQYDDRDDLNATLLSSLKLSPICYDVIDSIFRTI
ncbi:unnamed protein product, partial [Meganyctiphanes norvegica]